MNQAANPLASGLLLRYHTPMVEWKISEHPVEYEDALRQMESRVESIIRGEKEGLIWFLEHPPLYTAGTSANAGDLLEGARFPVYYTGRGGQFTYHGPGQRVVYLMLDLKRLFAPSPPDIRAYVQLLENALINTLQVFGIKGEIREGRVGVWVNHPTKGEAKIAALGIRVKKWVCFHGLALNVAPNLSHFSGIIPCGIREFAVTSLADMGIKTDMHQVDSVLNACLSEILNTTSL